jgi:DNA-binding CsgD family transcriptional regulator
VTAGKDRAPVGGGWDDALVRRSSQIPLVARTQEVARFRRAFDDAAAGEPGVLLLGGDAGVGKTRLVNHLAALATEAGGRSVVAHCVDLGEVGIPYLPFTEALGLLRDEPDVAQAVAERPALARLLDPNRTPTAGRDDHAERLPLMDGVAGALASAGRPGAPLVLVVEDLHWADPSTRDVLRFLATRLRSEHLLLVGTYRSDDVDRRHPLRPLLAELHRLERVEHVELGTFTPDELREFTTAVNDAPLPEQEFAAVLRRSEGNAFFAEELLAAGPAGTLPWSLADILHARLERLPDPVRQVVRLASVGGRQVREDLLLAAAARTPGLDDGGAVDALRDAVAQQVLGVEQANLAFRHALLAEALYLDLLPGERASTHRAYLAALQDDPTLGSPAERAHHALQGHDLSTALSASYDAAAAAHDLLAPAEQLRHLEQVLSLWESVPDAEQRVGTDRVAVALAAAGAASRHGRAARAVQLARRAVAALDGDPGRQASVRVVLARYLMELDEIDAAAAESDLAFAVLDADDGPGPSADLAVALAVRGRVELNRDEDDRAREYLERAVAVAHEVDAPQAETDALASLAIIEVDDPDTAARLVRTALERAREVGDLSTEIRCWSNLAMTHYYAGRLAQACEVLGQGLARARETATIRSMHGIWMQQLDAILRYTTGDLRPTEVPAGVPAADATMIAAAQQYAAVARGDDDVLDRAAALRDRWEVDGFVALVAGGCQVDALTWAGRHDEAVEVAAAVVDHLGAIWSTYFLGRIWISALALAALAGAAEESHAADGAAVQVDRRHRADELLEVARATAERGRPRGGSLGPEGQAWLCRAEAEHARVVAATGGKPADPVVWETTVAAFGYGYRYEVARSRLRWAQALHAAGDVEAGARETLEALAEAERTGARPLAEAAQAWARRARVALPGARRTSSALTDREEEVLALVAKGLSNRQIGERLFISTKTASVHVSNILAKLAVSGRAEAVAVATRRGLLGA